MDAGSAVAAWNRGDIETFCEYYAEDTLFLSPSGPRRGRSEVLARYRKKYPDRAAMGTLTIDVIEMRPVLGIETSTAGDAKPGRVRAVSVAGRWTLRYPDREDATGLTLIVFHRTGDGWAIVQDASM